MSYECQSGDRDFRPEGVGGAQKDTVPSSDDLEAAISHLVELQNSWRCKRPVIMEVVNLEVQSDGKSVKLEQGEKTSESAVIALEIVKV
ncbi:hypothetical protein B0H14DRAFT_3495688 [Mycena olivaceomarginata]|nr:hypothetical protein B0H14DRAFT_3495688 [Mycena olivaceomarginata]